MSKVFLAYRPLHPPTGIEHCCFARFTDPGATNLITAHVNILEVFRLHTLSSGEVVSEVCASFTLAGKVEGLHVINLNRAELPDVLLISFASAKAVLVCYEPEAAELAVLDLYAFDHDAIGVGSGVRADAPDVEKAGGLAEQSPTVMDPSSRCAAMLIYGTQVAMMPLRRDMLWRKVLRVVLSPRADRASKRKGLRLNEKTTVSMAMTARRMASGGSRKRRREEEREGGLSAEAGPREAMVDLGAQGQVQEARREEEREEGEGGEEEEGATDDENIYDEEGDQRDDGVFGVGREGSLGGQGVRAVGETTGRGREEQEARADEMEGAEFERELGGEKPFVIKLREELQIRGVVKDMRFLGGFMQPTLAILHEQPPSWAGILAARAHTCHVSVLTCGLSAAGTGQKATVLYQVNLLPHDSFRLSPPPPPLSGFLVISTNALLYIDEARVRCTMATNGFGPITVPTARYPLQDPFTSGLHDAVSLNGAHVSFLAPRVAVVTAGSGELLVLHLVVQGGRVHALRLVKVGGHGAGVLSSAVEAFWDGEGEQGTGWLVIGSKTVDSVLLRYGCGVRERERRSTAEGVMENGIADDKAVVMMDADGNGTEGLMHADAGADHSSSGMDAHDSLTAMQNGVMDGQHDVDEEVLLYGQTIQESASAVESEANGDDKGGEEQAVEELVEGLSVTVVDTFPTLGPIMDATLAPRLPRDAYELSALGGGKGEATEVKVEGFHTRMSDAELVCTAGQGKEGALTVLRRGLIAETLGRAALPMGGGGCRGAWVLPSDAGGDEGEEVLEGFVVVAMDKTTIIVRYQGQTFEAVSNPEDVGFYGQATTLALAPVGGGLGLVQVYGGAAPGLRLLWEGVATQDMGLHSQRNVGVACVAQGVSVAAVHVLDPYAMLVLSNGQIALLVLDATEGQFVAADMELPMESGGVTAACLFYWRPGQGMGFQAEKAEREEYEAALAAAVVEDEQAKDDEETLLYDEEARDLLAADGGEGVESMVMNGPSATVEGEVDMEVSNDVNAPSEHEGGGGDGAMNGHANGFADGGVYCALCRRDGTLEVVSLPSFHRVFMTRRVPIGPRILRNAVLFPDLPCFRKRAPDYQHDSCSVQDIRISTVGPADGEASSVVERVVMALWTSDEDLLVYAAQPVNGAAAVDASALPWSFVRVQHDLITRPPRRAAPVGGSSASVLHTFDNIAGQAGMIIGGQRPACVLAERGQVTVHALNVRDTYTTLPLPPSARVLAFAPFTDCDNGFLVVHGGVTGPLTLSVCSLDANTALGLTSATGVLAGARATARKVGPLGMEVRKIVALDGTRVPCYAVSAAPAGGAVDEMEEERERAEEAAAAAAAAAAGEGDDEDDPDAGPRGTSLEELNDWTKASDEYLGRPPLPGLWSSGGHQIWVMGGAPLRIMSTVSLKKGERCLTLGLYKVRRRYGLSVYLVAGTATLVRRGEDTMCPGRLIVYRINKGSDDKVTLTQVDEASRRSGPVTALAQLGYHIIIAAGATLWVYSFNEAERLKPIAFWDAPFYVVSLRVIKSYVSVADAFRSVQFLRWYDSDPMHTLELLGKSYESVPGAATASHYVIDPPTLAMLVADDRANVQVLQYDKTAVESRGGDRLLRRADFHLGYRISCLQGLRPVNNMGNRGMRVLVFGTIEGAAGALVPLEERTFRQLFALQGVMINALLHACALNPRAYRLFEPRSVLLDRRKKGFLDGELLWRYTALDAVTQGDLAGAVGTTREAVLDLLLEIDMLTWVM